MLDAMRKRTGSLVVKLFMGLLALSFAVWGIGDIFRGGQDPTVADVGGTAIRASDLQNEYGRALESVRRMTGGQIDAEQARALGVVDQALEGLITRAIISREVAALGLYTPDVSVREAIESDPTFQNQTGSFNRIVYQSVLNQNRLAETQYEELLREQLSQQQLVASLSAGLSVPKTTVETLRRYRDERRIATVAMITTDNVDEAPSPDDAAIAEYYAANEADFMAPEYRRITVVTLKPADLLDEVEVDEERVREEYDFNIDTYTVPQQRNVDRLVFDTEDEAAAAFERLLSGEDFYAVGADLTSQTESEMTLGTITRDDLPDAETAEAIFGLEVGRVSAPMETPFGWYLVRINQDYPGRVTPFEEVVDDIRNELKIEQASDAVYELSNRLEDERAGGATIEEAAGALGIAVSTIGPVDLRGLTPEGTPAENLPPIEEFLSTAFQSVAEIETDLLETAGNTSYVLRVDAVIAPEVRPLADIRDEVVVAWQQNWREDQAKQLAEAMAGRVGAGEDLATVAAESDIEVVTTGAFTRDGRDLSIAVGPNFTQAVFALAPGDATEALISGTGRYAIAVLDEIQPAEPDQTTELSDDLQEQLRRGVQGDVEAGFNNALRLKYGVQVNQSLVDNLFDVDAGSP